MAMKQKKRMKKMTSKLGDQPMPSQNAEMKAAVALRTFYRQGGSLRSAIFTAKTECRNIQNESSARTKNFMRILYRDKETAAVQGKLVKHRPSTVQKLKELVEESNSMSRAGRVKSCAAKKWTYEARKVIKRDKRANPEAHNGDSLLF